MFILYRVIESVSYHLGVTRQKIHQIAMVQNRCTGEIRKFLSFIFDVFSLGCRVLTQKPSLGTQVFVDHDRSSHAERQVR